MSIKQILTFITLGIIIITMTACGSKFVKDNPDTNASIYGNGGMQVRKGDYLYFVNGFFGIEDVTSKDTKYGNVVRGGIYRTKLDNGNLVYDDDGQLVDCDQIVSKIVGYEGGGFYIYDDYIYYATPNNEKDKYGELTKKLVDIYRCKINGDDNTRIYTTSSEYSSVSYNVAKIKKSDNSYATYLMILDGDKLVVYEFDGKKNKGQKVVCEKDVDSVAWLEQKNYIYSQDSGNVSDVNKYIYYTQTKTNSNSLNKYNLITGQVTTLADDNISKYSLKALKNDKLYYENTKNGLTVFASNDLNTDFSSGEKIIAYNSYKSYYVMDEGGAYEGGILMTNDSGMYFIKFGESGDGGRVKISSTAYNILFVDGSKVYVRSDNIQINVIDLQDSSYKETAILGSEVAGKYDGSKYVDYDGRFIVYYCEVVAEDGTNYYTHFVDLTKIGENDLYVDTFVGKYADNEQPKKEEEDK